MASLRAFMVGASSPGSVGVLSETAVVSSDSSSLPIEGKDMVYLFDRVFFDPVLFAWV